jgi:hypothetical protein
MTDRTSLVTIHRGCFIAARRGEKRGRRMDTRLALGSALVIAIATLGACNLVTGADDIRIKGRDHDDAASGSGGGGGGSTTGTPPASSGVGAGTPAETEPADGVQVTSVKIYQGSSRPLMENGQPSSSNTPVVAGRDALFRVFYTTDLQYEDQPVTARVTIDGQHFDTTVTAGNGSTEPFLDSTLNVEVPGSALALGARWRVDVLQAAGSGTGQNAAAGWPTQADTAELAVQSSGQKITVTLVPMQYNADGSGRLPDTSQAQLDRYHRVLWGMYPVAQLELVVHAPVPWSTPVQPYGSGWDYLLQSVADMRAQENAPSNNIYYGIFEGADSLNTYCQGGCVLGLAILGSPGDPWSHAAVGIGFSGDDAAFTAGQELAHTMGLGHAPCGTSAEPGYPYPGASIGVWGYDLVNKELVDPGGHLDVMSYCHPQWISDYNFTRLFQRFAMVNGSASLYVPAELQNLTYDRVRIDADGQAEWLDPIVLARPPMVESTTVTAETEDGTVELSGHLYRYAGLDGGVLFVARQGELAPSAISFALSGHAIAVSR